MKEIDFDESRRFIALLGKPAGTIRLRAFLHRLHPDKPNDKGRKGGARKPLIKQWQSEGRGVYVVVNDGGDTNAEITACRAFFAEWDDRPRESVAGRFAKSTTEPRDGTQLPEEADLADSDRLATDRPIAM